MSNSLSETTLIDLVGCLKALGESLNPGRGRETCELIRGICQRHNLNEDEFLPAYVMRVKRNGQKKIHGFNLEAS